MKKQTSRRQTQKKAEVLAQMDGAKLLGEIITWNAGDKEQTFKSVRQALLDVSLDEKIANELLPRYAFARACKQMEQERMIDLVREENDVITFQFTKKLLDTHADEWTFKKETNLKLNKITGKIDCKVSQLETYAQQLLDKAVEVRTTADITRIVQRLFDREADLFPIRDQGGAYFVPECHVTFVAKIESFLNALGGKVNRFPVPSDTKRGNASVQEVIATNLRHIIHEHEQAVATFGLDTSASTLERSAEKIKATRVKIEAYATYLMDQKDELLKAVDAENQKLVDRIQQITEDRKNNPEAAAMTNGHSRVLHGGVSTKERVYHLWKADKTIDSSDAHKKIKGAVQQSTVKSWIAQWSRGQNLPACAKKS